MLVTRASSNKSGRATYVSAPAMQGEVTIIHDDGSVTVRLHGYGMPITTSGEHLSLVAKTRAEPGRRKKLFDRPD